MSFKKDINFESWVNSNTKAISINIFRLNFLFVLMTGVFQCMFGLSVLDTDDDMPLALTFYLGPIQLITHVIPLEIYNADRIRK